MLYVRGNRRDYDLWAASGCTGWSYDEVLPYFLKSEDQQNPYLARTGYHSTGGYLTVFYSKTLIDCLTRNITGVFPVKRA